MSTSFFVESTEQSAVKSAIVSKYFDAWAKVIIGVQKKYPQRSQQVAYIDLFAGPGRYKDGTRSTPLLVLEKAIANPDLRQRLITLFNDKNEDHTQTLEAAVRSLPGVETLANAPVVRNKEVGTEIVDLLANSKLIPTLMFVDPWGYKGLSLDLVNAAIKDWGCDCIFFFNYNRINAGLSNPMVVEHMNALFGQARADDLRRTLELLKPGHRELTIVEALAEALQDSASDQRYVLPFFFKSALPLSATVRLGLNTAAADNVPLVVLYGATAEVSRLKAEIAAPAAVEHTPGPHVGGVPVYNDKREREAIDPRL